MWLCYAAAASASGAPALMPERKSKGCWHGAQWKGTDGLAAVVLESWVGAPAAGARVARPGPGARGRRPLRRLVIRCQCHSAGRRTMPSSLRPRDQPGPPQGQTVLDVVPPVLASGEWSCQCAVDSSAPWSTSCRRAGVGRLGQEWSHQTSSPLGLGVGIARLISLAEGWACHVDPAVAS